MTATATATKVKERPILFSSEMVKAILEGRKTQTRRVVKGLPEGIKFVSPLPESDYQYRFTDFKTHVDLRCPYGRPQLPLEPPRDRLWVRETWQAYEPSQQRLGGKGPLASAMMRIFAYPPVEGESIIEYKADKPDSSIGWRSSLHLPRWASRITLEITNVRVERLQEISATDCAAEGVMLRRWLQEDQGEGLPWLDVGLEAEGRELRQTFKNGWDSINAKRGYSWDQNPWVWCIAFRKL